MKRIIEGVTYNTDTATAVARWEYEGVDGADTDAVLYQTRGGAFFIVHTWNVEGKEKVYFEATTRDGVQRLVESTDNLAILNDDILKDPPEASAEQSPGATLYLRVPSSLKDQAEAFARSDGVSVNVWAMRCMERCSKRHEIGQRLGEIMQTYRSYESGRAEPPGWPSMLEHVNEQAEAIAFLLGWRREDFDDLASSGAVYDGMPMPTFHRPWPSPEELDEE